MAGKIYIIGAGPGDEKLITLKGVECIKRADIVVFDRLVNPKILQYAKADAELVDAGPMPDFHGRLPDAVNRRMIGEARSGKIVARVKRGNPFVFGKGEAEAEYFHASGIEFEIIPGITAAVSVPARADIPVAHRDYGPPFHGIAEQEQPGAPNSSVDYRYPAGPLSGTRILISGMREQAAKLIEKIEALGGEAIEFPAIKMVPPADFTHFDYILRRISRFQWVIFTSINGVRAFFDRLKTKNMDIRQLYKIKLGAIGEATGNALNDLGFRVDFIPEAFPNQDLLEDPISGIRTRERVLIAGAGIAGNEFANRLKARNVRVENLVVYDTVIDPHEKAEIIKLLEDRGVDYITFTSAATVRSFISIIGPERLALANRFPMICIGPITEQEASQSGLHVADVADTYTIDGLVAKLASRINRIRKL